MKFSAFLILCLAFLVAASRTASGTHDVGSVISAAVFDEMLKNRNDSRCRSDGFYTYKAFLAATRSFPGFGTTGKLATRKREIAAFLGQTSFETTGEWLLGPSGPYVWGYCHIRERTQDSYCTPDPQWPCARGRKYYGRGPFQLTGNHNYGPAGKELGVDLLKNPDLVATDPVISFKTAIWYWMTARGKRPSSHDVITGKWVPSADDKAAGRVPGYGVITNIVSKERECGHGADTRVLDRFQYYIRYCDMLKVKPGKHVACFSQSPFE